MAAGAAATLVVRTAEAPLERIKILLQNQNMAPEGHRPYLGVRDAAARVAREQGIAAFWRGNLTNCSRVLPSTALRFAFMDQFQSMAAAISPPSAKAPSSLPLHLQMLGGALSGGITAVVVYPLDLTRTKLSAGIGINRQYAGIADCIRQTTREQGWRGNYRGLLIAVVEISPYTALSMGGFEYFKHLVPGDEVERSSWRFQLKKVSVGWLAGLSASLLCYPLDTVKRQLMLDGSRGFRSKYGGSICRCLRVMHAEGGLRAFYRGCLFNALKSAPCAGLTLVANDLFRDFFGVGKR